MATYDFTQGSIPKHQRLKLFRLGQRALANILSLLSGNDHQRIVRLPLFGNLPRDMEILAILPEWETQSLLVKACSMDWAAVPSAGQIPFVDIELTMCDCLHSIMPLPSKALVAAEDIRQGESVYWDGNKLQKAP